MPGLFDDLRWRGLIAHSTDPAALQDDLDQRSIRFYLGCDPTAPSLHVGNLLQLITVQRLQAAGHTPFLLVGGSTGLIGDPRLTAERGLNPVDQVQAWVERIKVQVAPYIDFDGPNPGRLVNNYDWTHQVTVLDFLRDIGQHFSISRMLAREVVRARLESGISYTEFSYVLLQSYDYLVLHRDHGVSLQTGGSDQFGNITAGVDLIRRVTGHHCHGLATPLVTKADGSKYGKTAGQAVWLDPALTSPYAFHQFFLNAEDAMVVDYLKLFTRRDRDDITELARLTAEQPQLRAAQRALADDLTDLVHSQAERRQAALAAQAVFGRENLRRLTAATLAGIAQQLPSAPVATIDQLSVVEALAAVGLTRSKGEARRAVQEGGAYVNNQRVAEADQRLSADDWLPGGHIVLRRGKKTVGLLRLDPSPDSAPDPR
ncbi:MAG: tyrosine--tRNA ligase [Propionibacteriaceae bacterium]|nr:tyrosine--tRNA ligase [Propionibacteriaceae bacterium]